MNQKMNFLISALFTLIISIVAMAQTPGTGVYTPNAGGIAPRATLPGSNGTYQPGVITTQPPPTPGTGAYSTQPPPTLGTGAYSTQPPPTLGTGAYSTQPPPTLGTGAYSTRRGVITRPTSPVGNGTYQMNTQGAGAVGGTAPRSATYNTKALGGQVGGSQILNGPQVGVVPAPTTGANSSYGSYSRNRNLTGFGGAASSQTTTAGSGAYSTYGRTQSGSTYGRTQSGSTYGRTQSGSTYNGTQSSSTYGASRRRP
jgi:hypothetical protein